MKKIQFHSAGFITLSKSRPQQTKNLKKLLNRNASTEDVLVAALAKESENNTHIQVDEPDGKH